MKATGIVRRIDDLGRVVIPKEIRRTLRLREGTPLEIFTSVQKLNFYYFTSTSSILKFSPSLERVIGERQVVQSGKDEKSFVQLVDEELEGITAQVVAPIICEGDAIGAEAIMSREPRARFGEMEMKLSATACGFLGRQMES